MSLIQAFGILVLYALGAAASCAWATSLWSNPLLGLLLWTSFFGFCNAVTWTLWWSREHWMS